MVGADKLNYPALVCRTCRWGMVCFWWSQGSRLKKPSYEFHFEAFLKFECFSWRVGSDPRHQSKNIEMKLYIIHIETCAWSILWYMFWVQCEELRITHLTPLLVVPMPYTCWFLLQVDYIEDFKWCLRIQFGVAFGRVVLRGVYFKGPNRVWRALRTSILNIASNTRAWGLKAPRKIWKGWNIYMEFYMSQWALFHGLSQKRLGLIQK